MYKKAFYLLIGMIFLSFTIHSDVLAQDSLSDIKFRKVVSAFPYYDFGKGIGITSPDSLFQLKLRFRMQNRVSFLQDNDDEEKVDAQIRRLRLRLEGYVGNPKFTYLIQLSFAPGDLGGSMKEGENINIIRDAMFFYQPNHHWNIGFGQTKLPGNRQRFNSSGALQLTDRSINNAEFTIDRDFGVQVHYLYPKKNEFAFNIKSAITTGEGRNKTNNKDMNLAYTGKLEIFPFGVFTSSGEYFEGDLKREQQPKLMLSAAYQFNNNARQSQGQLGDYLYEKRNLHSLFLDGIFKYKGLALMTSYMNRRTDRPITFNALNPSEIIYVFAGEGMDYQASYLFQKNYELIGRYSWQKVHTDIFPFEPNKNQYTLGLTKYIWEHAFKLQLEATYSTEEYFGISEKKDNWYLRFQIEMGI